MVDRRRGFVAIEPAVHAQLRKLSRLTGAPMGLILKALISTATPDEVSRIIREQAGAR